MPLEFNDRRIVAQAGPCNTTIAKHVFAHDLIVVGVFTHAGGIEVRGIARWEWLSLSALGTAFTFADSITISRLVEFEGV